MSTLSSQAIYASYPSETLTVGAGVAIFHLATARVVVCWHSKNHYWFLPKGRKNANEDVRVAAEREGFEESGYRNRLLPLPLKHRQTDPDEGHEEYVIEPIWTQLMPLSKSRQYLLSWYAAETLTGQDESEYDNAAGTYRCPKPYSKAMTIAQRMALDRASSLPYEPVWHEGTGVNEDESHYRSHLLSIDEAIDKLGNTVMADVVRRAWQAIEKRMAMEAAKEAS